METKKQPETEHILERARRKPQAQRRKLIPACKDKNKDSSNQPTQPEKRQGLGYNLRDLQRLIGYEYPIDPRQNTTGYVAFPQNSFYRALCTLYEQNRVRPGMTAVDLGSGLGDLLAVMMCAGLDVAGIELNAQLAELSRERLALCTEAGLTHAQHAVIAGSYFTEEYCALRASGEALALVIEGELQLPRTSREHFFPVATKPDPTPTLSTADVLVNYPWPIQIPSLLELYATTAKENALLLLCGARELEVNPIIYEAFDLTMERVPVRGRIDSNERVYLLKKE